MDRLTALEATTKQLKRELCGDAGVQRLKALEYEITTLLDYHRNIVSLEAQVGQLRANWIGGTTCITKEAKDDKAKIKALRRENDSLKEKVANLEKENEKLQSSKSSIPHYVDMFAERTPEMVQGGGWSQAPPSRTPSPAYGRGLGGWDQSYVQSNTSSKSGFGEEWETPSTSNAGNGDEWGSRTSPNGWGADPKIPVWNAAWAHNYERPSAQTEKNSSRAGGSYSGCDSGRRVADVGGWVSHGTLGTGFYC